MRRALIAGNWKMHGLRSDGLALADALRAGLGSLADGRDLLVCPPYTLLAPLAERLSGSPIALGGQDLHWETRGAFTSGISGPMLRDAGCVYVLVGHSERRALFGDTGEVLARKLRAALGAGLRPVYCVGEQLDEREAGRTAEVLGRQFDEVLTGLTPGEMEPVTLAYEPVWAIGTGRTATPEMAQEAHAGLRERARSVFGAPTAASLRILYGGSVKGENAAAILGEPDVDGVLVGGASLKAEEFLAIAAAAP